MFLKTGMRKEEDSWKKSSSEQTKQSREKPNPPMYPVHT